jgi:S-formylglutathione hydrolase
MTFEILSEHACFGGVQGYYKHASTVIGLPMKFGVYVPPQARGPQARPVPVLIYLAGIEGADAAWDFGTAAGFYLDARQAPWAHHWRMESYVTGELPAVLAQHFPVKAGAHPVEMGLFGHSMGGHGALTLALRHPGLFKSVSAFAPIAAPMHCPWGVKAFTGYLGSDKSEWAAHDATALVMAGKRAPHILIDQGLDDKFLAEQLHPHQFERACEEAGQPLTLRRHAGYDHGYFFISTFVEEHLRHHAKVLVG